MHNKKRSAENLQAVFSDSFSNIICLFFYNLCVSSILFYRSNAVQAALHRFIAFAYGHNLTVGCFQTETEFAGFVCVYFKFRMFFNFEAFRGLVFDCGDGRIFC